jgi:putative endonuclease
MKKDKGKIGEDIAVKFLSRKGYKILKRNYRYGHGEIDIIAMDKDVLIFVEVRMKLSDKFGFPEDSVTIKKREQLKKIASAFIQMNEVNFSECRFDVIGITFKDGKFNINHIENAFQ